MPQLSQVLRERTIGMLTARMSSRAVARELNVHFSTHLQCRFREFGSMSNQLHNRKPRACRRVDKRFADVNVVNRVPHGGCGVMVWAGISYRQQTQVHFIYGNLNAQKYRDQQMHICIPSLVKSIE
jgi:hypothetical protein